MCFLSKSTLYYIQVYLIIWIFSSEIGLVEGVSLNGIIDEVPCFSSSLGLSWLYAICLLLPPCIFSDVFIYLDDLSYMDALDSGTNDYEVGI
jgi:hypothetical protein